jgi:hypothetical protein
MTTARKITLSFSGDAPDHGGRPYEVTAALNTLSVNPGQRLTKVEVVRLMAYHSVSIVKEKIVKEKSTPRPRAEERWWAVDEGMGYEYCEKTRTVAIPPNGLPDDF